MQDTMTIQVTRRLGDYEIEVQDRRAVGGQTFTLVLSEAGTAQRLTVDALIKTLLDSTVAQ